MKTSLLSKEPWPKIGNAHKKFFTIFVDIFLKKQQCYTSCSVLICWSFCWRTFKTFKSFASDFTCSLKLKMQKCDSYKTSFVKQTKNLSWSDFVTKWKKHLIHARMKCIGGPGATYLSITESMILVTSGFSTWRFFHKFHTNSLSV